MDAANEFRHNANNYPPTGKRLLHLVMLDVVHQRAPSARCARCEQLVRDYPDSAHELLEQLLREQRHDQFFMDKELGMRRDTGPAINILRSMIARAKGRRLLAEIEGGA